jgi:hypothetical protein
MTTALKDPKIDVPGNSEKGVRSQTTELRDKKIENRGQKKKELRDRLGRR